MYGAVNVLQFFLGDHRWHSFVLEHIASLVRGRKRGSTSIGSSTFLCPEQVRRAESITDTDGAGTNDRNYVRATLLLQTPCNFVNCLISIRQ